MDDSSFLPSYYDPSDADKIYVERTTTVEQEANSYKKTYGAKNASTDSYKVALFAIDCQISFCNPQCQLYVPGSIDDIKRISQWIYRNVAHITTIFLSLDTHKLQQIFHPSWWVNKDGENPAPFSTITAKDIENKNWIPVYYYEESLEYVEKLSIKNKYELTIWPYHAILGSTAHAIVPSLMEAVMFHSFVRDTQPEIETKGMIDTSENYSVFSTEITSLSNKTISAFNESLLQKLLLYDRVYVVGQAKSHCVLFTLEDICEKLKDSNPKLLEKIWIVEDAMSPVPPPPIIPLPDKLNFPEIASERIKMLAKSGMKLITTQDSLY